MPTPCPCFSTGNSREIQVCNIINQKHPNFDRKCISLANFNDFQRGNLGSPRAHTLTSPRDHTLTSPRRFDSGFHNQTNLT